ncbi:hypothetical protein SERLADRAFT_412477 [Serpula lacrymans var. lacrymans S7.9]|uniref:BRCA2 OB1 domain-containing protein n=1 Tax=Serpula lacrymans var. lacrymans (strain S7.9) TaxID=578457 RepID=F8NG15_SERL9|nr:uncharacterized protein SERLADRAFT_412477 [Serpula lacrymans var. lacrymans S7.9]EGO30985.1 hypothetical protein SERLADRAFT_412477 [Serpula lacrymans var. lacrymans S7.9]
MGINGPEICGITPSTALEYRFRISSNPSSGPSKDCQSSTTSFLGPSDALNKLHSRGCSLATEQWVENHWSLILWKLAGMVALDPYQEFDPNKQRWCWRELCRQLLYRYERELNNASLPALRLITTGDAPASSPMVLCVSGITWSEADVDEGGAPVLSHPQLEVTDGWYRLRARVDQALARAVRKGTIRVGRKIAVTGARLSSERKEPVEVLEAYNSTSLVITGNSSHLASWHAKLGFQRSPWISTLNSLTADGGNVAVMAFVVIKVHPVAFVEFIDEDDGSRTREGPRTAKDEAAVDARWKARRENQMSKLWSIFQKRMDTMDSYARKLEQRAGPSFRPKDDDSPPSHIDNLYDDLEDGTQAKRVFATLGAHDAGWLAQHIRERCTQERLKAADDIEQELQAIHNFRVILVKDEYFKKHPPNRKAQLTVWDVLNLTFTEGFESGSFQEGQKFLVNDLSQFGPRNDDYNFAFAGNQFAANAATCLDE